MQEHTNHQAVEVLTTLISPIFENEKEKEKKKVELKEDRIYIRCFDTHQCCGMHGTPGYTHRIMVDSKVIFAHGSFCIHYQSGFASETIFVQSLAKVVSNFCSFFERTSCSTYTLQPSTMSIVTLHCSCSSTKVRSERRFDKGITISTLKVSRACCSSSFSLLPFCIQ